MLRIQLNIFLKIANAITWALLVTTQMAGCGMAGIPFTGQVIDAITGKPIEGTIVIAMWTGASGLVESRSVCYHVETATSDKDGQFHIPGWINPAGPFALRRHVFTIAYKPGYEGEQGKRYFVDKIDMELFKGDKHERLEYLESAVSHECFNDDYREQLIPYTKAIYEEAVSLQATPGDMAIVKSIKYHLDVLEAGWDAARKAHIEN